jgi:hypothetical protein
MTDPSGRQARAEAMLGELAELALVLTRELAVRVRASEDVKETLALAEACQKTSQVARLTLALDFKLQRAAAREAETAKAAEPPRTAPRPSRPSPLKLVHPKPALH